MGSLRRGSSRLPFRHRCLRALLAALVVPAGGATPGPRQDGAGASPEATNGALTSPPVEVNELGLLDVHVRDVELAALLEMLSLEARANIVATSSVNGRVSANLYGVTLQQALDAVLTANGLAHLRSGNTVFVGTPAEIAAQLPPPTTQLFKLRYISPAEAVGSISALLSTGEKAVAGGTSQDPGVGTEYVLVTAGPERLAQVEALLAQIDVRPRQVLIEATILRATLTESEELGIDFTLLGGVDFQNVSSVSNAGSDLTTGPLRPHDFEDKVYNVNTNFAGNVSPGGFTFGVIHNNVAAFIRALEEITDVVVVANPKVLALNKREAEVIVGRRDGYLTTTITETTATQTVQFIETGTQIKLRPVINEDGTVRMTVYPKDSNGGLSAANLPFEETTEAQAEVLVDDGHTILIGGLFRERTVAGRSQIPVLGNIPFAGALFQSHVDQVVREEVVILLTVHVLKNTPAEQAQFAGLLQDIERVRAGVRTGLAGLGRERLAQAYYQEAVRQAELGNDCLALLNTRMALHNQPKHISALRLRDRLLGEHLWHGDGTRMRTFMRELLVEPGDAPIFNRPRLDLDPSGAPLPLDAHTPVDTPPEAPEAPAGTDETETYR